METANFSVNTQRHLITIKAKPRNPFLRVSIDTERRTFVMESAPEFSDLWAKELRRAAHTLSPEPFYIIDPRRPPGAGLALGGPKGVLSRGTGGNLGSTTSIGGPLKRPSAISQYPMAFVQGICCGMLLVMFLMWLSTP